MLEESKYYHIYNRGNNSEPIFFEEENYHYFLKLLRKYISPIANIYSYCLIKNHYHLLIRVKEIEEVDINKLSYTTVEKPKKIDSTSQFSNFFNAYTQAINKRYKRTGSLFEPKFNKREVDSEDYFIETVVYINSNPVKHKICLKPEEYRWSSFNKIATGGHADDDLKTVLELFGGTENFIASFG